MDCLPKIDPLCRIIQTPGAGFRVLFHSTSQFYFHLSLHLYISPKSVSHTRAVYHSRQRVSVSSPLDLLASLGFQMSFLPLISSQVFGQFSATSHAFNSNPTVLFAPGWALPSLLHLFEIKSNFLSLSKFMVCLV